MEINPGGRLSTEDIVGRQTEINRYWRILERQSLLLSAERRIGKTHIVLKMHAEGHDGFISLYQELEAVHSLMELIRSVYKAAEEHLPRTGRLKGKAIDIWSSLLPQRFGDLELPNARSNWKLLLANAVDDLLSVIDPARRMVLIWDEFPLMLYNINQREGADAAIQLLDVLRHLRNQNNERLRFIFTGSVGLHLVLRMLKARGNANDPTNDMSSETVPPMSAQEAINLTTLLLGSLTPEPQNSQELAEHIYKAIGGFPYHIHHVVDQLSQQEQPLAVADIEKAIDRLVFADNDPAHFGYYVERIRTYYNPTESELALIVLDVLANQSGPLGIEEITNLSRHERPDISDELVRDTLSLLRKDHYLEPFAHSRRTVYGFRWPLVKSWWRGTRL